MWAIPSSTPPPSQHALRNLTAIVPPHHGSHHEFEMTFDACPSQPATINRRFAKQPMQHGLYGVTDETTIVWLVYDS